MDLSKETMCEENLATPCTIQRFKYLRFEFLNFWPVMLAVLVSTWGVVLGISYFVYHNTVFTFLVTKILR